VRDVAGLAAGFVVFGLASALVLHLAEADRDREGSTGARSGLAIWLLAFFHANTVVAAAGVGTGKLPLPETPFLAAGIAVGVAGWLLFLWATLTLVRRADFEGLETRKLVTTGWRHPQSLGWTVMLLGIAIGSRSVIALLLVLAFSAFAARYARIEERELAERFGDAFERYRQTTRSMLGVQ
jgi:protein-S-isoprenylcysteine O-methyltransferase Ste14